MSAFSRNQDFPLPEAHREVEEVLERFEVGPDKEGGALQVEIHIELVLLSFYREIGHLDVSVVEQNSGEVFRLLFFPVRML